MEQSGFWTNVSVLITGVCGTVGRELLRQVCQRAPRRVIGIDNNETELPNWRKNGAARANNQLSLTSPDPVPLSQSL